MKIYLISDDKFLQVAIDEILGPSIHFSSGMGLAYINDKSPKRKFILIDERVKDLSLYNVRTQYRFDDYIVLLGCGLKKTSHSQNSFNNTIYLKSDVKNIAIQVSEMLINAKKRNPFFLKNLKYLNDNEIKILNLLLCRRSVHEIKNLTDLSLQSVYRYRISIVTKFGYHGYAHFYNNLLSFQRM